MLVVLLIAVLLALSSAQNPSTDFVVSSHNNRERLSPSELFPVGDQSQEYQIRDDNQKHLQQSLQERQHLQVQQENQPLQSKQKQPPPPPPPKKAARRFK
ncbi:gliadoralin-A-like [Mus caroli]|uniref:Gliadoralin-A-like n=1 Tax=Mus caroli TaxID=10089 RepID=A0A6P5PU90_MUSCR|nr:gliadoralin-A-like [Mus caroli]